MILKAPVQCDTTPMQSAKGKPGGEFRVPPLSLRQSMSISPTFPCSLYTPSPFVLTAAVRARVFYSRFFALRHTLGNGVSY
jgi:hypothetical protein